ncbi:STAS/SEC14 domain-containing protein [Erythrobacter sp. NE805]|uniref:STAS/SEC14 domain-containing protein n=1 Tax=Erythrobacter sp. NE805 TaxID=3389875 RepID=UPI00396B20F0
MKVEMLHREGLTILAFAFDATLDHAQVIEMARVVESAIAEGDALALLLDMRATEHISPGAVLSAEGAWTSLRSIGPVRRYAVVAAPAIAAAGVEAFGKLLPLESRAFDAAAVDAARAWVAATPA